MFDSRSIGIIALMAALVLGAVPTQAEESKYPDWSGQWIRVDTGPPRYDPSKPLRAQDAPLKPEYQAVHAASMRDQTAGGFGRDNTSACLPSTMPRAMTGVSPMEFAITPKTTFVLFERLTFGTRRIFTDDRDWPKEPEPLFLGYSIGKWRDTDADGRYDTLEIETHHVRGPRSWDQTGMPLADDDEGVIKERLFLDKNDPSLMHDEMTVTDNSLTRPWSSVKIFRRQAHPIWIDDGCVEGNSYVTIEGETYATGADGKLMPIRKDQPPPDLKYFKSPEK